MASPWTHDELILALDAYTRIEAGEIDRAKALEELLALLPNRGGNAIPSKFNDLKHRRYPDDQRIWDEFGNRLEDLRAAANEIKRAGTNVAAPSNEERPATAMRFLRYFGPLLDALRSIDPEPMKPSQARDWIRGSCEVPASDLTRLIENGKQSIFENDVHWARFYLTKAGLMASPRRGLWALTDEGRQVRLTPNTTWEIYVKVRDASRIITANEEEPAPGADAGQDEPDFWFVGATWDGKDQLPRFLDEGIWQNQHLNKDSDLVRKVRSGDRIVVKSAFVRRRGLPFDVGGEPVAVMRIKATGTVLENANDGLTIRVAWDRTFEPRDWYLYTYLSTIVKVDTESESGRRLIDYVFHDAKQDYAWFLEQPYWAQKYRGAIQPSPELVHKTPNADQLELQESLEQPSYDVTNIISEGAFLSQERLAEILERWRTKKNVILQGPPGTGKTWLAKRLGFALIGSNDRSTLRSRLRVVQFHPSLAYEDFVRGWRPAGDGKLALADGILMQAIDSAASEPDQPFVLVIEEINRGNPAQIFGEMLTLLEDSKRRPSEAVELAYSRTPGERVHIPDNLYVIGTMNIADRSLAIVDLALRRRFAFVDLEPTLGQEWMTWCTERGIPEKFALSIKSRLEALNAEIANTSTLGPQFRIGHSFVTPDVDTVVHNPVSWFQARVETEIGPLLDEYWYDASDKAKAAR